MTDGTRCAGLATRPSTSEDPENPTSALNFELLEPQLLISAAGTGFVPLLLRRGVAWIDS